MVSFAITTLCPVAVMGPTPAFGALAITAGQGMGSMSCPASLCPSERVSTIRHDVLQAIHDQLAQSAAVAVPGMVIGPEPQRTSTRFLPDIAHPRSFQHIPLYLLHVSLIR